MMLKYVKIKHRQLTDKKPRTILIIIFRNIYSVLVQVQIPTSKTKLDILYNKVDVKVVSRVAERLKLRILGN